MQEDTLKQESMVKLEESQKSGQRQGFLMLIPGLLFAAAIARFGAGAVRRETEAMRDMIGKMAKGNLNIADGHVSGDDEISMAVRPAQRNETKSGSLAARHQCRCRKYHAHRC